MRIDFGGGWTDVETFAHAAGGAVVNAKIDRYVTGTLEAVEEGVAGPAPPEHGEGHEGLRIAYGLELPAGSGLGSSAALNVVWLSLVNRRVVGDEDRKRIAELAYGLEAMLGILGGRQDQYAAALGGFNLMRFGAGGVEVEPLAVPAAAVRELEARSLLCSTGQPRLSGSIHEHVWGAFRAGRPETVRALYGLREVALAMVPTLLAGDLPSFADLLSENWEHQRALHPSVSNPRIDALFEAARTAGALGGKACGAGGGGCLYFVCEPGRRQAVAAALAAAGARPIRFAFEFAGLTLGERG